MGLGRWLRERRRTRILEAARSAEASWDGRASGVPHGRPRSLIVSLTSFPARYGVLRSTLHTILTQTVRPDRVVLWLAKDERAALTASIEGLTGPDFEVATCQDWRSYKKIVPALAAFPEADIVTADDDMVYHETWLRELIDGDADRVGAHRAHRIRLTSDGRPLPYGRWRHKLRRAETGPLVFPVGAGGVLYRAGALPDEATRVERFQDLAPTADDVWLYWMNRLGGGVARRVASRQVFVEWPGGQAGALKAGNLAGTGNDDAVAAMIRRYGFPAP